MGFFGNLGSNMVSSLTGSIDKALLCVRKIPPRTAAPVAGTASMELVDFQNRLNELQQKSFISSRSAVQAQATIAGFHVLQVKYNPSKLSFNTYAGSFMQPGPGGEGANTLTQITVPAKTTMTVELLFDAVNHADAFMFEKFTNLSVGGLVTDGSAIGHAFTGGYSVRPQIDALIGMLTRESTREVVFYWSDMVYAGEVTDINASYTMFNPDGHPIRGTVRLSIQQESEQEKNPYWNESFDALFPKEGLVKGGSVLDNVGNLLNFR